ncbi:MAG: riboflavin biosynthesis protein RibF [Bacteroidales bacterium]|nr:riboflavin biosynthesis protein RibF [Bacteroidales bacterium]
MKIGNIGSFSPLRGKCIVTVGMFDGVHLGHRHVIERLNREAASRGLEPVVVTFDCHPRIVLGKADNGFRLLSTADERSALLAEAGARNVAVLHFTPEMAQLSTCRFFNDILVGQLGIRALLLGYDNMFGNKSAADFDRLPFEAEKNNVGLLVDEALYLDAVEISSTQIRKALAAGDIALANRMLGHPYSVSGTVVPGRKVGRTMGFPTANVKPADPLKAMPSDGVYAVKVNIDGHRYVAMANLGPQPTFGEATFTFEVHIIDYNGDLYGRTVTVEFTRRLRDIVRFDSAEALQHQLQIDLKNCRQQ